MCLGTSAVGCQNRIINFNTVQIRILFILSAEAEVLNRRYIHGELTHAEHTAALLAWAGLSVTK